LKLSNPSTGFRLSKAMLATVDTICATQDLTRSQVFRRSIAEYLKDQYASMPTEASGPENQGELPTAWYARQR
jgi:hypothetical protein